MPDCCPAAEITPYLEIAPRSFPFSILIKRRNQSLNDALETPTKTPQSLQITTTQESSPSLHTTLQSFLHTPLQIKPGPHEIITISQMAMPMRQTDRQTAWKIM
ncbi:hypothetical protein KC19_N037300 [Ceratodon purpureus]|nr:hypothetical protein KC19_N037300 [Ceratodon purpureus]